MNLTYRAAALDEYLDGAQLRFEMAQEMRSHDFMSESSDWRSRFVDYFVAKHRAGDAQMFLAYDGETPVGSAVVSIQDDYRRFVLGVKSAWVNAVYVRPAYRRQGIGKALMLMVDAWAKDQGCARVRLRASDDGRLLYASLGFVPTSEMELRF